jgi:hypothetical protein
MAYPLFFLLEVNYEFRVGRAVAITQLDSMDCTDCS